MTNQDVDRLAELLVKAGTAHHAYEQEELKGEYDENWPLWYAAFLVEEGIAALIKPPPGLQELSGELARITKEHKAQGEDKDWNRFVADALAIRYLKQ